jgi:outer membrane biosynthesis protein TonB
VERKREEIVRELAETAADKLAEIVDAAERRAEEIESEARGEAERIVKAAREEAREQVDRAQGAVDRLVQQADDLRSAVGRLGSEIASQVNWGAETEAPEPEVVPEPPRVPEPEPPREPEPEPPREPEPQPPPSPEPGPAIVPEPQPPSPEMEKGPSTEDLLAQLRGEAPTAAEGAVASRDSSPAAARLVAMKMALDGASREEIERHLADNYELSHADKLLDDVLARAKP